MIRMCNTFLEKYSVWYHAVEGQGGGYVEFIASDRGECKELLRPERRREEE